MIKKVELKAKNAKLEAKNIEYVRFKAKIAELETENAKLEAKYAKYIRLKAKNAKFKAENVELLKVTHRRIYKENRI